MKRLHLNLGNESLLIVLFKSFHNLRVRRTPPFAREDCFQSPQKSGLREYIAESTAIVCSRTWPAGKILRCSASSKFSSSSYCFSSNSDPIGYGAPTNYLNVATEETGQDSCKFQY